MENVNAYGIYSRFYKSYKAKVLLNCLVETLKQLNVKYWSILNCITTIYISVIFYV